LDWIRNCCWSSLQFTKFYAWIFYVASIRSRYFSFHISFHGWYSSVFSS